MSRAGIEIRAGHQGPGARLDIMSRAAIWAGFSAGGCATSGTLSRAALMARRTTTPTTTPDRVEMVKGVILMLSVCILSRTPIFAVLAQSRLSS